MPVIRFLIWDGWNVVHIARHAVTPEEVEEACRGQPIFRDSYHGRILAIGPTGSGRIIAAALDPEPDTEGVYYPVTAPTRRGRRYHEEMGA